MACSGGSGGGTWEHVEMQNLTPHQALLNQSLHFNEVHICVCAHYICETLWVIAYLTEDVRLQRSK